MGILDRAVFEFVQVQHLRSILYSAVARVGQVGAQLASAC